VLTYDETDAQWRPGRVDTTHAHSLDALSDVVAVPAQDGQLLAFDAATGGWLPKDVQQVVEEGDINITVDAFAQPAPRATPPGPRGVGDQWIVSDEVAVIPGVQVVDQRLGTDPVAAVGAAAKITGWPTVWVQGPAILILHAFATFRDSAAGGTSKCSLAIYVDGAVVVDSSTGACQVHMGAGVTAASTYAAGVRTVLAGSHSIDLYATVTGSNVVVDRNTHLQVLVLRGI
jgi:hypothetical protein